MTKDEMVQAIISMLRNYDFTPEDRAELERCSVAEVERRHLKVKTEAERDADYIEFEVKRGLEFADKQRADRAAREPQARKVFSVVTLQQNISQCEANFKLLFNADVLNTVYEASQAIASNAVPGLAQPTKEENKKRDEQRIENHNRELLSMSPVELRNRVRQEQEQKNRTEQTQQAQTNLESQRERESVMGFPKVPSDITRQRVLAASPREIKYWGKRYGQYQLNRILAGQENQ
jgi:hypothetical protein